MADYKSSIQICDIAVCVIKDLHCNNKIFRPGPE